ncbi:MAG: CapA family protein [Thermomicrobiales bacterium]
MAHDQTKLSIALTGDSAIMRGGIAGSAEQPIRRLVERLRQADVAFTNLEVLANDFQGYPAQETGGDHMAGHAWVLDELIEMGFDLFATATNHTLDYSIEGLLAMMAALEERGVKYAGVGRNLGEARMPAYFDSPRGSVALISCCSTFKRGQQAGAQRPDMQGRPGINPLRFTTTYRVKPDQLAAIQQIAEDLGFEKRRQEGIELGFSFPPDDPERFPFGDMHFRAGDAPATERALDELDVEQIAAWVRDARLRADRVIVSLHAHEPGETKEEPAGFIREFSRRMIDEGADIIAGHGPHLLRGIEIYRGKPIFYSLGNFIDQHDLIYKHPADAYEKFRLDPGATPAEMARSRNKDDTGGFVADRRYWQTVVPVCQFEGDRLARIEILPVSLGQRAAPQRRGRPGLAEGNEAREILSDLVRLSEPFGTHIEMPGDYAEIRLPDGSGQNHEIADSGNNMNGM